MGDERRPEGGETRERSRLKEGTKEGRNLFCILEWTGEEGRNAVDSLLPFIEGTGWSIKTVT